LRTFELERRGTPVVRSQIVSIDRHRRVRRETCGLSSPEYVLGGARVGSIAADRLDVHGKAHAIYRADIEIIFVVRSTRCRRRFLVESPLGKGGCSRWSKLRLAGVVYTTSAAGLALRNVRGDVITATGSNPDIRAYTTVRAGVRPSRRYVYVSEHFGATSSRVPKPKFPLGGRPGLPADLPDAQRSRPPATSGRNSSPTVPL